MASLSHSHSYKYSRLTVVRKAGGQQVRVRADALLGQVNGHPNVLHPPLHLWCTAAQGQRRRKEWEIVCKKC